jgi:hypothetical protein
MRRIALPALALAVLAACGGGEPDRARERPRLTTVDGKGLEALEAPGRGPLAAYVTRTTWLRAAPGGRPLVRLRRKTQWGSPRVLSVVEQRGPWVAVLAPELRNHQVGWLDARRATRLLRVPYTIEVRLGPRVLIVRRDGRVMARTRIAVGRPSAPTPVGRFAVTDKLLTGSDHSPYGCCALALSGHQPRIPQGWGGGDRLAIHATPAPETIGQAASLGCMRATNGVMRRLVYQIPLGTPVRVRS